MERFLIVGGAGFIGSHFVDRLLAGGAAAVTVYDNFSSGQVWHLAAHQNDARLKVVHGEVGNLEALCQTMTGHDTVIHLASNPDIARAATEPAVDFWQGTHLTFHIVEAMRQTGTRRILYASGSGVYGERGWEELKEDRGPYTPISTYGASKLAGETLISSYCYMFDMTGRAFRFANVVGARQTHGVGLDFLTRLGQNPAQLRILGDGTQSKAYIHVSDIIAAVLCSHANEQERFQVYNVAPEDTITVTEIAEEAVAVAGLRPGSVRFDYTGGDRGWKGDVPVVRLNADRIRALGWKPTMNSRQAIRASLEAMQAHMLQDAALER